MMQIFVLEDRLHNSNCVQGNYGKDRRFYTDQIFNELNCREVPFYLLIGSFIAYLANQNIKGN
jgi:hypothetical protein